MFQPGEEGPGGALPMLDEGVLEAAGAPVDAAFGVHVRTGEPGIFSTKPGQLMAGGNILEVVFHGQGGHGSRPEKSIDPVPPLVEFCQALQVMATRQFSVFDPIVITITRLSAGEAINVIPPSASMGATVRTLSEETTRDFPVKAKLLAESIAAGHGARAEVTWTSYYPPTINDAETTDFALGVLKEQFGEERVRVAETPRVESEDFSFVLQRVPGTFYFLSVTPEGLDPETAPTNHSPLVTFDDSFLADQAASLAALAYAHNARQS